MFSLDELTRNIGNKNNLGDKNTLYESVSPFFTETFDDIIKYLEENNPEYADYLKRMKTADKLYQGIYKAAQEAKRAKARKYVSSCLDDDNDAYDCGHSARRSSWGGGCGGGSSTSWGCGGSTSSYGGC